jgi:hypothetical protein
MSTLALATLRRWGDGAPAANAARVGVASMALLALFDIAVRDEPTPRGDDLIYERMADAPFEPHTFPFAYRVLVPTIVHVLPVDHTLGFSLLGLLATGGSAAFCYLLLRHFEVPAWLACALSLCLAVSPPLLLTALRQGRNVDPESVLVMFAGCYCIAARRVIGLACVLALGCLTRESALFLVAFAYAFWADDAFDRRAAGRVAAISMPALAMYAAVRWTVPTVGRTAVPGYGAGLVQGRIDVVRSALSDWPTQLRRLVTIFGPLWLALPFGVSASRFVRRGLVLVACCVASMAFALDWGRIALLFAPVVYVAAGVILADRRRLAVICVASFALLCVTYAVYMQLHGVQSGIIDTGPPPYPVR